LQVARIFVPSLNRANTVAISGEVYISENTKKGVPQDIKVIEIILVDSFLLVIWLKKDNQKLIITLIKKFKTINGKILK